MTFILDHVFSTSGFPGGSVVKNTPANEGDTGSIPGSGRSPGEGDGNPLQYSCLGNPMDRGAWPGRLQSTGSQKESDLTERLKHACTLYLYYTLSIFKPSVSSSYPPWSLSKPFLPGVLNLPAPVWAGLSVGCCPATILGLYFSASCVPNLPCPLITLSECWNPPQVTF